MDLWGTARLIRIFATGFAIGGVFTVAHPYVGIVLFLNALAIEGIAYRLSKPPVVTVQIGATLEQSTRNGHTRPS